MSDIGERNHVFGTTAARIFDHVSYSHPSLTEALSFDEFSYEPKKKLGIWNMMVQGYRNEVSEFIVCFNTNTNWQKEIHNSLTVPILTDTPKA